MGFGIRTVYKVLIVESLGMAMSNFPDAFLGNILADLLVSLAHRHPLRGFC